MQTKHCTQCDRTLSRDSFYRRGLKGLQQFCKECQKVNRRNSTKPHEAARRKFKFSDQEYFDLMEKSREGCQICGDDMGKKICFDHCHDSGEFRGLLCHRCNTMLGLALDNVETLSKAILYLNRNG